MRIAWATEAWADYVEWQKHDPRIHERINELISSIQDMPFKGIGKPEPLKHDLAG